MITILSTGSRGDIQPYIALAQQLKRLGKDVRIAGSRSFADFVMGYGLELYPLSLDLETADIDPRVLEAARSSDSPLKMLLTFNKMKNLALGLTEEMYSACEGSDLIVYHPGATIGYFAGETLGIPSVLATPFPMHRTREVASVMAYGKTRMPVSLSYYLLQRMLWMAGSAGVASVLKKKNGRLPSEFACPFERVDERHPAIVSCSNHVFPRPADWNRNIHQHGYWFVEEPEYTASEELSAFLAEGERPVYVGFGSVFDASHRDELIALIIDALRQCGKRGIISGMGTVENLPENVFAIGSAPHTWLFERVAAVCHHGGAGTTAAGFRAGVPSVIVPSSNDQFAWAHRAYDLGVASEPIYRRSLISGRLAGAIEYALGDKVVANAKTLSKKIAEEDGAMECARVVTECLESSRGV